MELPGLGDPSENPKHTILWKNMKNDAYFKILLAVVLIWSYGFLTIGWLVI